MAAAKMDGGGPKWEIREICGILASPGSGSENGRKHILAAFHEMAKANPSICATACGTVCPGTALAKIPRIGFKTKMAEKEWKGKKLEISRISRFLLPGPGDSENGRKHIPTDSARIDIRILPPESIFQFGHRGQF